MAGSPSTITESSATACTTRPRTSVESPSSTVECSTHSRATGDSATRGGATFADGSGVSPTASNSLISGGKSVPVALICANS